MRYFGAKEVMSFLGKKLVGQFRGEVISDMTDRCKRRLPGLRIKHRAKMSWIKMYDKVGSVLRVETVINQPEAFKVRKRVRRGDRQVTKWVPRQGRGQFVSLSGRVDVLEQPLLRGACGGGRSDASDKRPKCNDAAETNTRRSIGQGL